MTGQKHRVLCIDDDEDTCELMTLVLDKTLYEVITATTLAEAVTVIKETPVSLIIVDEKLPDGSGLEFIRTLRAQDARLPIIMHSANAQRSLIEAAKAAGANDYLVKPNGWSKIDEMVRRLTQQSQS